MSPPSVCYWRKLENFVVPTIFRLSNTSNQATQKRQQKALQYIGLRKLSYYESENHANLPVVLSSLTENSMHRPMHAFIL